MKKTLVLMSMLFAGSAFASNSAVHCQAKSSKGDTVTLSFCASETRDYVNTFLPCAGEKESLVTVAYFGTNPEGLDIDPIVLQLPASEFNLSLDDELLSLTTQEVSTVGILTLTYANQPENKSYNDWQLNVKSPEDTKGLLKIKGHFKTLSCSYKYLGE